MSYVGRVVKDVRVKQWAHNGADCVVVEGKKWSCEVIVNHSHVRGVRYWELK
jgi:hypothetical protein